MPDAATIRATVERYAERHTAGDIDGILSCFASDARAEDPVGSEPHVGTDALRAFFEGTHSMADSLEIVITGMIRVVTFPPRSIAPMTIALPLAPDPGVRLFLCRFRLLPPTYRLPVEH